MFLYVANQLVYIPCTIHMFRIYRIYPPEGVFRESRVRSIWGFGPNLSAKVSTLLYTTVTVLTQIVRFS